MADCSVLGLRSSVSSSETADRRLATESFRPPSPVIRRIFRDRRPPTDCFVVCRSITRVFEFVIDRETREV
jgi:hypothetical protein